jgi:hypothetical protein
MRPEKGDPHTLFALQRKQYSVPHYQRRQTWNEENHWQPFWEDVEAKANDWLADGKPETHYLGAVVLANRGNESLRGIDRVLIIDGQQRLSTLQYLLQALRFVAIETGWRDGRTSIETALYNPNEELMNEPLMERHKVLPTFRDRAAHLSIMEAKSIEELQLRYQASFTKAGTLYRTQTHPRPLETVCFFYDRIVEWLKDPGETKQRQALEALHRAIMRSLQIIVLWLDESDDPQVIFESLNGRGAPLRSTDLIKNFIFMSAESDVAAAAQSKGCHTPTMESDPLILAWDEFDCEPWTEQVTRGRFTQTRLEWLIYYALQAETGVEVDTTSTYKAYRDWAAPRQGAAIPPGRQIEALRVHGQHLLALLSENQNEPIGIFGRVANALDVTTTTPVALLIASKCATVDQQRMFRAMASYLIRREACGLTKKSYNQTFLSLLRELRKSGCAPVVLEAHLLSLKGEASVWPDDDRFQFVLRRRGVYGNGSARGLCRLLLAKAATHIGATTAAEVAWAPVWGNLHVEHLMPQSWYEHWPLSDGSHATEQEALEVKAMTENRIQQDPRLRQISERERLKNTIGNLTILNSGLNEELRNSPWSSKRTAIGENTQLRMNFDLAALDAWGEPAIGARSERIGRIAIEEWPRPLTDQDDAIE